MNGLTRRNLLRGLGAGGLAAASASILAACGSGNLPAIDTNAKGFSENATGRITIWCRAGTQTATQQIADAYAKSGGRVKVTVTPIPDAQFVTKLATSIRGGKVPDLVDFDLVNAPLFYTKGAFADLTDRVNDLGFVDRLSKGHMNLITENDRHYGIPYAGDYSVIWFNTELCEKAGVDPDEAATDLDHLMEAAKAVRRLGDDVYGWSFPGNAGGAFGFTTQPMIWAAGTQNDLVKGDLGNQAANVAGNEALEAMLEFHRQLWQDRLVPEKNYSEDGATWGSDFKDGTVGIFPGSYNTILVEPPEGLAEKITNRLITSYKGGTSLFSGGDVLCMPNGAPNPSGAWEFCTFALALEQQSHLPNGGMMPVRSDAATGEFRADYPQAVNPVVNLDKGFVPSSLAYNLIYNQASGPWQTMIRAAIFGGDVTGAMKTAQDGYDRLLTQAQV